VTELPVPVSRAGRPPVILYRLACPFHYVSGHSSIGDRDGYPLRVRSRYTLGAVSVLSTVLAMLHDSSANYTLPVEPPDAVALRLIQRGRHIRGDQLRYLGMSMRLVDVVEHDVSDECGVPT
jgi:hypothetical protein